MIIFISKSKNQSRFHFFQLEIKISISIRLFSSRNEKINLGLNILISKWKNQSRFEYFNLEIKKLFSTLIFIFRNQKINLGWNFFISKMKNHFRKVFFFSQYFSNIEKFSKENIFFRNRKRFSESFRYLGVRMLVFRNTTLQKNTFGMESCSSSTTLQRKNQ